jgi:ParB family transcriptional regulator, chromosome partitioning protein
LAEDGKRRTLGRGLSALFGEDADAPPDTRKATRAIPIEQIRPGRYQPRRHFDAEALSALAASIREKGILQPLLVRPLPDHANAYELIAGERRWRAAQQARLHEVPVLIRDLSDQETLEIALIENLQREDLNPVEEAEAYARLMDEFQHTQEELARAVGKSRSHVANTLRLLALPQAVRDHLFEGRLTAGHARSLIGIDGAEDLARDIIARGLSVRQTEALVQQLRQPASPAKPRPQPTLIDADTIELERLVSQGLGLEVKIRHKGNGGELVIQYKNFDQLDHLIRKLG